MIKAEIVKGGETFALEFPQMHTIKDAYELAQNIAAGFEYYETDGQILDLGNKNEYDMIRVWEEQAPEFTAGDIETQQELAPLGAIYSEADVTFLAQTMKAGFVWAASQHTVYMRLVSINGRYPLAVLSEKNLETVTDMVVAQAFAAHFDVDVRPLGAESQTIEGAIKYVNSIANAAYLREVQANQQATAVAFTFEEDKEQ